MCPVRGHLKRHGSAAAHNGNSEPPETYTNTFYQDITDMRKLFEQYVYNLQATSRQYLANI